MTTSRKASEGAPFCGSLKGLVLEARDVMSPIKVKWELDEPNIAENARRGFAHKQRISGAHGKNAS